MATRAMGGRRWSNAAGALLPLALILGSSPAAGKWALAPEITVREIYTDNASLSDSRPRSDFITQVTPRIVSYSEGARFNSNLDYSADILRYSRNSQGNRVANHLNAVGSLEAVERFFFVDVNGNIDQAFISPLAAQPIDISTVTANRIETRTFGISPYVLGQAGDGLSYEVRNRSQWTKTNDSLLPGARTTQYTGRLARPVRLFGWTLDYDNTKISYSNSDARPDLTSSLLRGKAYFQPDAAWQFSASAGSERNNYALQRDRRSYYSRGAGLAWRPGARTSAEFEVERRFFGTARLARLDHRTRLTAWTFEYSRNISNFQTALLRPPPGNTSALLDSVFAARYADPIERRAAVAQFMRASSSAPFLASSLAFFTQQVFIEERLEASAAILGRRNSVAFTAFGQRITALSGSTGAVAQDVLLQASRLSQHGLGIALDHEITPFTTVEASARRTYARQEVPSSVHSRNDYLALTLTKTLSRQTSAFSGVSSMRFSASPALPGNNNVRLAFVGLNIRF